ncbi:MAG: tyrosine-type recombinase/integrase [Caldilineaceae bacterium]|nr:tyrosine-type recombinase/integrase [Caldilineaceae bacterium]
MSAASKSKKTQTEYRNDLVDLVAFLGASGITRPAQVGLVHLRIYQADLEKRGYKPSTRNRKTYAIKGFFRFLHEYALVQDDIAKQLIPPTVERGEPRFLSEAEYTHLLQACSSSVRDTAIIQLFLQTGIRLTELVGLSVNDVTLSVDTYARGAIRIKRSGGHATIPLNDKAQNALKKWLETREPTMDTALFLTALKKPMGKRSVQLMLEKYLSEAGIENASVQSLRHTMVVHHLAKGTPRQTLADILGDDPATLDVYVPLARRVHQRVLQEHML